MEDRKKKIKKIKHQVAIFKIIGFKNYLLGYPNGEYDILDFK
jgi:hypothetical protein